MNKIEFFNIYNQDKIIHNRIIKKISHSIKNNKFILTDEVRKFEKNYSKFCKVKYCVGVANGTDALFLSLKALDLKKGDEIIIPAMTWKSTLTSVLSNNLKPILVDINKNNSNLDLNDLKKKITKKTKAIIVVHLYGNPGEIYKIKKIIRGKNIKIIEDAAQGHGALETHTGKKVGSIGDIACFSFYPGKNLGAYGDAGCITTNSKKYYNKIFELRNLGYYKKYNKADCRILGINSRLDTIQAIVLNEKLKKIDLLTKKRRNISSIYNKKINNHKIKKLKCEEGSVHHQYVIRTNNRKKFIYYLKKNNISCGIHYSISINNLKLIKRRFKNKKFVNAEALSKQCISLPINPNLKKTQVNKIVRVINSY